MPRQAVGSPPATCECCRSFRRLTSGSSRQWTPTRMAASPWRRSRASRREIGDQFRASRPFLSGILSFPKTRSGRIRAVKGEIKHHRMARLTNDRLEPCRARPELHLPSPAAQTRIVSVARIRLDFWKSVRSFKGLFCDDISGFESYHPRQAVGSPPATCECRSKRLGRTSASGRQPGFMRAAAHQGGRDRACQQDRKNGVGHAGQG
jgi:hypothetical protein